MTLVQVRKKYQITLPAAIRKAAGISEGDLLTAQVQDDRTILLRPRRLVDADEAFFYTPEWQAAEREADEDIRLGQVYHFDNVEGAIGFLHNHDPEEIERDNAD